MFQFKQTLAAAAALSVMAVAALPVRAADQMDQAQAAPAHHHHMATAETVETRIQHLHDKLKITEAQSAQWAAVAQVMRDNNTANKELIASKRQNEATMTAVEDLQAYAQVAEAHAQGVKKLATVFETLYDTMSPEQKAVADEVFRAHKREMHHSAAKAH